MPSRSYEEIAQIKVGSTNDNKNMQNLRTAARSIGADGLIIMNRERFYSVENANVKEGMQYGYTAIAIRYR